MNLKRRNLKKTKSPLHRASFYLLTALLCLTVSVQVVHAKSHQDPIDITSDSMVALDKAGNVVFKGNVVAKKDDLTIYCDELKVLYSKKKGDDHASRALERLEAKGDVKIVKGDKTATGEKAVYDKRAEVIVITGEAKVWQGKNMVQGNKITFYVNEEKSMVEGSNGGRVRAIVYPSASNK